MSINEKKLLRTAQSIRNYHGRVGTKRYDELYDRMSDLIKEANNDWESWVVFCFENNWDFNSEVSDFFA
jgi:hypothetical protein